MELSDFGEFNPDTYEPDFVPGESHIEMSVPTSLVIEGIKYSKMTRSEDCGRVIADNPRFRPLN